MHSDPWLSERLGRPAWTVEDDEDISGVERPAFVQAKIDCADVARVGALEAGGMRVVDTNVTLRRIAGAPAIDPPVAVRDAEPGDRVAIEQIARSHYTVSRFHLDPLIPDEVAGAIKADWAGNFFDGKRGDRMLVAEVEGRVVGFHLILDQEDHSVIDLIAVRAEARGAGAGTALVCALLRSERPVVVGTQISNTGALRLYERLGFTVVDTKYVLHGMFD